MENILLGKVLIWCVRYVECWSLSTCVWQHFGLHLYGESADVRGCFRRWRVILGLDPAPSTRLECGHSGFEPQCA